MTSVLTSGGKAKMRGGKVRVGAAGDPCCCDSYLQARRCDDGTLADVFMTPADAEAAGAFSIAGACYYFNFDDPPGTPGTVYSIADVTTYADCETCLYPSGPPSECDNGANMVYQPPCTVDGGGPTTDCGSWSGSHALRPCDPDGDFNNDQSGEDPDAADYEDCIWNFGSCSDDPETHSVGVQLRWRPPGGIYPDGKWEVNLPGHAGGYQNIIIPASDLIVTDGIISGVVTVPATSLGGPDACTGSVTVTFGY